MDNDALIRRLMATFLDELQDHVRALERDLLVLEKETDPAAKIELYNVLFRTAHSLKGAARSVNVGVVEAACHRLEEIFASMRDGRFRSDERRVGHACVSTCRSRWSAHHKKQHIS